MRRVTMFRFTSYGVQSFGPINNAKYRILYLYMPLLSVRGRDVMRRRTDVHTRNLFEYRMVQLVSTLPHHLSAVATVR